ncbi:hypothetical protein AAGS61_09925 [Lysinibacillus sp. KU-BSD001]|uniref:hypothetical protein n=1 Tax=Lysinibacillus sp. KU-BSD001 TaxID=3141328 RepID=UPI0036E3923A
MLNKPVQSLRSITLTNGNIKDLASHIEQLNIRGSVSLHQEVSLQKISTHGYSSFYFRVEAHTLKSSGSCKIKGVCEINEVMNAGNLKIRKGQVKTLNSSGKLTIEQYLQTENMEAIGIVKALEIQAKSFSLKLSGESTIERLIADEVYVEKDKLTFSFLKKKLNCKCIKGKTLNLSFTTADVVEGDVVVVGNNCNIRTLYYTESYSISPNAKVQQIIRRERE